MCKIIMRDRLIPNSEYLFLLLKSSVLSLGRTFRTGTALGRASRVTSDIINYVKVHHFHT